MIANAWLPLKCTWMVKVVTHCLCLQILWLHYSITVQRNHIKLGVHIAPDSSSLSLSLWHCSSFDFVVENDLVPRFDPHSQMYSG